MIMVAGKLNVSPETRDEYLAGCRDVMIAARHAPGCLDFHLSADSLESGRINVFEAWETVAAAEAFRGTGPSAEQQTQLLSAEVYQHEIASSVRL